MSTLIEFLTARSYFEELQRVASKLSHDDVDRVAHALFRAYESGRTVYTFGNGGSAALASHFACDLGKGTAGSNTGRRFRVLALTDNVPALTAWANDSSYDDIFSEQLANFVQPRDIAFAISGSGNSKNVLRALRAARKADAVTLGISGFNGGEMTNLCDMCVIVPSDNMQIIEDLHLAIAHSIFRIVSNRISSYSAAAASAR